MLVNMLSVNKYLLTTYYVPGLLKYLSEQLDKTSASLLNFLYNPHKSQQTLVLLSPL